jgi:CelD/BcsL family acetyltransferase involved in cellulose biosynthesis
MPSNSLFLLRFNNIFEENGKLVEVMNGSYCPVIVLPGEKDTFLESLSRNRREQFRRHFRILCEDGELQHVIRSSADVGKDIDELKILHRKRWGGGKDPFFKFLEGFIDISKDEGIIQLDLLKKNQECIAAIMHLNYNNTRYMYLFAVNMEYNKKISVGNVFLCMCILKTIEDKIPKYELLKGDEPYKFHFAEQGNRLLNISHYQNRIGPVFFCSNKYLKNIGKILLR